MRDAALVQRKLKDAFYGLGWGNTPAQCAFILNAKANNVAVNRAVYVAKRGIEMVRVAGRQRTVSC